MIRSSKHLSKYLHTGGCIFEGLMKYKYISEPPSVILCGDHYSILDQKKTDKFNIRILRWHDDAHIALHDHDMYEVVGMKVLVGALKENILTSKCLSTLLPVGSISFFPGKGVSHEMWVKENPCITIHVEQSIIEE